MSSKMQLGIIGCGGHSVHHGNHLGDHFEIGAVWDPDRKRMSEIESPLKAATLDELLASPIEAVLIGSPDEFHLRQIEQALRAGKHVFCEKPLLVPGESIEQLEEMFDFAESGGLVLTSCHPRRCDRPMKWLKEAIGLSTDPARFLIWLGKVMGFSFDFSYHEPVNDWKASRSLLLDHVNHEVDLANFLFGIQGFQAVRLYDSHDRYAVAGIRDDDIAFHFQGTRRLKSRNYPEWCRVRFERGEVALDMMTGVAHISDHETKEVKSNDGSQLKIDYDGRLAGVMNSFAKQITRGEPGYLTRAEMLMNTEAGIVLQGEGMKRINVR